MSSLPHPATGRGALRNPPWLPSDGPRQMPMERCTGQTVPRRRRGVKGLPGPERGERGEPPMDPDAAGPEPGRRERRFGGNGTRTETDDSRQDAARAKKSGSATERNGGNQMERIIRIGSGPALALLASLAVPFPPTNPERIGHGGTETRSGRETWEPPMDADSERNGGNKMDRIIRTRSGTDARSYPSCSSLFGLFSAPMRVRLRSGPWRPSRPWRFIPARTRSPSGRG